MVEFLVKVDQDIFLFLNGLHTNWLDSFMFWISGKKEWFPFYLAIIVFIIYHFKWNSIAVLIAIGITILLADQTTSGFMKPFFERLRPSHEPLLNGLVHHVNNYKGGQYGFASSHAANTFGLATFLWLLFKSRYKWIGWMFVWALIVSYSRIYLGVHYPGDIIVGGLVGILSGLVSFKLLQIAEKKWLTKTITLQ